MSEHSLSEAQPVSFGARLANSQRFADLFRDGMELVEETAAYLDGPAGTNPRSSSAPPRSPMPPKACG